MKNVILVIACLSLVFNSFGAQVFLSWTDNSNNESGFRIQRSEGTGAMVDLAQVGPNNTSFTDNTVVNGRTYGYRIRAFNAAGNSNFSNTISILVTGQSTTIPAAPGGLQGVQPSELVNVSTRGQITATDTTIIPGFVVGPGSGAKVLVRVVGPTLGAAPYNVPDVCADPRFEIRNSAGTVVASNDNWTGADVAAAAQAAGAFALPVGSKDAAVIVTLPPGNYTVVVRGVGGATGVGLAEVYKTLD